MGYKFVSNAALASQCYHAAEEALSQQKENSQNNNAVNHVETGDLQCPATVVSTPEKVSSTEKSLADCLSRIVVAVVKYRESYIK